MHAINVGTNLVVFDRMREGEPDEYLVAEDEDRNVYTIQYEWIDGPNEPEKCS